MILVDVLGDGMDLEIEICFLDLNGDLFGIGLVVVFLIESCIDCILIVEIQVEGDDLIICVGEFLILMVVGVDGMEFYEYLWFIGVMMVLIMVDFIVIMMYIVEIIDVIGCIVEVEVGVVVNELLIVMMDLVGFFCVDDDLYMFVVFLIGGIFVGFGVNILIGVFDLVIVGVGIYIIIYIYMDGNGCINLVSIDIIVDEIDLGLVGVNEFFICVGGEVIFGVEVLDLIDFVSVEFLCFDVQ